MSVKSYGAEAEFEASDNNDEFIASGFVGCGTELGLWGVVGECVPSTLFDANACLFFLAFSISDPIGTKVFVLYFLAPSSPVSLL